MLDRIQANFGKRNKVAVRSAVKVASMMVAPFWRIEDAAFRAAFLNQNFDGAFTFNGPVSVSIED